MLEMPSFGNSDCNFFSFRYFNSNFLSRSSARFVLPLWRFSIKSNESARFYARGKMLKNAFCAKKCLLRSLLVYKNGYQMFGALTTREE